MIEVGVSPLGGTAHVIGFGVGGTVSDAERTRVRKIVEGYNRVSGTGEGQMGNAYQFLAVMASWMTQEHAAFLRDTFTTD